MYGLSEADLALQARARELTDQLIPYEEYAEAHDGELPDGVEAELSTRADELGLTATNMPEDVGGRGCSMLPGRAGAGAGRSGDQRPRLADDDSPGLVAGGRHRPPARDVVAADGARRP